MNQPIWWICNRQNGCLSSPIFRDENKKLLNPPARNPSSTQKRKNSNKEKGPAHRTSFNKFRQAIKNVPGNQPSQNNPNVYFQTSLSSPRPESLIAAKPSGMVSWNNSPSSVWGCMGTWVSGYSQPLGIELGNVCPNFRSFYWTWDFFSQWLGEK